MEYEGDAQKLAMLEIDGNRVVRGPGRPDRVNRTLTKKAAGSYGGSDVSGRPFPHSLTRRDSRGHQHAKEEQALEGSSWNYQNLTTNHFP
jgi:hypothetical protein